MISTTQTQQKRSVLNGLEAGDRAPERPENKKGPAPGGADP